MGDREAKKMDERVNLHSSIMDRFHEGIWREATRKMISFMYFNILESNAIYLHLHPGVKYA